MRKAQQNKEKHRVAQRKMRELMRKRPSSVNKVLGPAYSGKICCKCKCESDLKPEKFDKVKKAK